MLVRPSAVIAWVMTNNVGGWLFLPHRVVYINSLLYTHARISMHSFINSLLYGRNNFQMANIVDAGLYNLALYLTKRTFSYSLLLLSDVRSRCAVTDWTDAISDSVAELPRTGATAQQQQQHHHQAVIRHHHAPCCWSREMKSCVVRNIIFIQMWPSQIVQ